MQYDVLWDHVITALDFILYLGISGNILILIPGVDIEILYFRSRMILKINLLAVAWWNSYFKI